MKREPIYKIGDKAVVFPVTLSPSAPRYTPCGHCKGEGKLVVKHECSPEEFDVSCPFCDGSGEIDSNPSSPCVMHLVGYRFEVGSVITFENPECTSFLYSCSKDDYEGILYTDWYNEVVVWPDTEETRGKIEAMNEAGTIEELNGYLVCYAQGEHNEQ